MDSKCPAGGMKHTKRAKRTNDTRSDNAEECGRGGTQHTGIALTPPPMLPTKKTDAVALIGADD